MTNARVARKVHKREEELVAERDSLIDVLNALMNMAAPKDGLLAVPLDMYLGRPRHPIYVMPTPSGILIRQDRDQHLVAGTNKRLVVMPEVSV